MNKADAIVQYGIDAASVLVMLTNPTFLPLSIVRNTNSSGDHKKVVRFNFFLRVGIRLLLRHADIVALAKAFDLDALAKHNKRILTDPDLRDRDAITNHIVDVMLTCLTRGPGDPCYPKMSAKNKTWVTMLGLADVKIPDRIPFGRLGFLFWVSRVYWKMCGTVASDTVQSVQMARQTGVFKDTPIQRKATYLISRDIAHKYGHDKGRQRNPEKRGEDDQNQADFVHRETRLDVDEKLDDVHAWGAHGRGASILDKRAADTDQIENELIYQRLNSIIHQLDTADKLAIRTQVLANQERIPFEAAFRQKQDSFSKLGIHSARAAEKRLHYLPTKYPELKVLRESLNR